MIKSPLFSFSEVRDSLVVDEDLLLWTAKVLGNISDILSDVVSSCILESEEIRAVVEDDFVILDYVVVFDRAFVVGIHTFNMITL